MQKVELTQSSYPVLVLRALESGLRNYDEIQEYILGKYKKHISTKTVYRHINLIKSLGFEIVDKGPYVIWPSDQNPIATDDQKFGRAAYPLMILVVLQSERKFYKQIAEQVYFIYKTRIERKAIGRNLDILGAIGYRIFDSWFPFIYGFGNCE